MVKYPRGICMEICIRTCRCSSYSQLLLFFPEAAHIVRVHKLIQVKRRVLQCTRIKLSQRLDTCLSSSVVFGQSSHVADPLCVLIVLLMRHFRPPAGGGERECWRGLICDGGYTIDGAQLLPDAVGKKNLGRRDCKPKTTRLCPNDVKHGAVPPFRRSRQVDLLCKQYFVLQQ